MRRPEMMDRKENFFEKQLDIFEKQLYTYYRC